MDDIRAALISEIEMTNNGKLMRCNVPANLRGAVDELLRTGFLVSATFLEFGDSIKLASK